MNLLGRLVQVLSAGLGFFLGLAWVATRWAGGGELGRELLRTALEAGVGVAALYTLLLGGLFWVHVPVPRARGLRMVVSPMAFTLSFCGGAAGLRGALWILGLG